MKSFFNAIIHLDVGDNRYSSSDTISFQSTINPEENVKIPGPFNDTILYKVINGFVSDDSYPRPILTAAYGLNGISRAKYFPAEYLCSDTNVVYLKLDNF